MADTTADTGQEPQTTDTTDQLPDWAREKLAKANAEAAKYRTRAKDTEQAKAAEFEAYKQELGKKLGLIEDDQPAPDDLIAAAEWVAQRLTKSPQQRSVPPRQPSSSPPTSAGMRSAPPPPAR